MRLIVLYGSQTGNSQDVAEQIWRESKKWGFCGPVLALDDYPIEQLANEHFAVFVVSTTGNGDEPDNMKKTWKFLLKRNLPKNSLVNLQFACLGLGDSSYTKFNYVSKKLNKRLLQLGANEIQSLGLCDDQHDYGLSAVSMPWILKLWENLINKTILIDDKSLKTSELVWKWKFHIVNRESNINDDMVHLHWPFQEAYSELILIENTRTTSDDHFQDVRLLRFNVPNNLVWSPGDILDVRPYNSDTQIESFFNLINEHKLDFTKHTVVEVTSAHNDMSLPLIYKKPISVYELAKYVWDFNYKPRQRAFELLAINCDDELEKEKLIEFSKSEGLDDLINYINRPRRNILEVLYDFPHATSKLNLQVLLELFPIIQNRSFSIASITQTNSLDILVAVVEYKTKLSTPRLGLCSNWLKNLPTGIRIFTSIKKGTMVIPVNQQEKPTPIIMIGPGTGIAPFRSIIQSKEHKCDQGNTFEMYVFFGCRNKNKDFHFFNDFLKWEMNNLIKVWYAFSRDQDHKVYVQHLIKSEKNKLSELIMNENAIILIAGSSKNMPKEVKEAFIYVLDGNEEYINMMIKTKRYQEETWS